MQITACPICGSKNISIGTLGDGIIAGLSSWKEVCRNCGYQGASLLFETEEDYNKYLKALKENTAEKTASKNEETIDEESDDLTEQDKEISALLDETADIPQRPEKKKYVLEFLLAAVLSIIFIVIIINGSFLGINTLIFTSDYVAAVLYFIGMFIGIVIFFFLAIVFVEMIYRSIR
jgi:transcription elongation factor Elf1